MILLVERLENIDSSIWFDAVRQIDQAKQVNKAFKCTPLSTPILLLNSQIL